MKLPRNRMLCSTLTLLALASAAAIGQVASPVGQTGEPGGEGGGGRLIERPISLSSIRNFHVTSLGRIIDDGSPYQDPYGTRACNTVSTHTDANFGGGSYNVQAGFGENEEFGATYTVPASEWPIKINLAEMIFATSQATQNTTTVWAVSFYQGTPATGARIFREVADDIILPYIRLTAGTNGVNVQFSVDPEDPDQIIIENNGSNQFSVSWSITEHNDQTANPCLEAPPRGSNAFPVTDVSGLAQGNNNWLFGLNCGPFGCPPNGGWARFNNLNVLCRPTGDIVTRVTWSSVSCQPGIGACCLPSGNCVQVSEIDCIDQSGTWRGEFSSCSTANCPTPSGACCFNNGFCTVLSPANCTGAGGTYLGNGVACTGPSANQCPVGACCLPDGGCLTGVTQVACDNEGGTFKGVGSSCATACPTGACCLPTGSCLDATEAQCIFEGGTWQGVSTTCAGTNCPQPQGACCLPDFCIVTTQATCAGVPGGSWAGAFTTCADINSNGQADICESTFCAADYNQDGGVTGDDVEAFFNDWSQGIPQADVNTDGGVDGQDVESFFVLFEAGGC